MSKQSSETNYKTPTEAPETTRGGRVFRAPADIVEIGEKVKLMLDMPGVAPEDVDITLEKRVLTIRGKVHPSAPEKLEAVYAEYDEGDYERAFTLSDDFDSDRIEAAMHNGVLTLSLARSEAAQPKKITVQAA